jgi:uncharacterized protein (DUF697 family)
MGVGVRTFYRSAAALAVTASVVPVTTGLTSPIAANQTQHLRFWVPISVGAAGGVRAILVVPAGGVLFNVTIKLFNTVAPSLTTAIQAASAAFTSALANAGSHWLEIEACIVNGTTAGNVDLQMAQNTSDATPMTVLRGASADVVIF